MTNRQHIRRRLRWFFAIGFGAWLLLASTMLTTVGEPPPLLIGLGMFAFVAAALSMQFGIRCLLCGGNLGLTIGPATFSFFRRKHVVNYCPYCGSSLDEPFDAAQQDAARERAKKR